ncbi:MAG: S24/S26 family peptidase [Eubacterium sp.]|nr:S24/S26 family peptidase [Eubacterium sp.]
MEQETGIQETLDIYGKYTSLTSGFSMWPLLRHHRDNIIVVKNEDRLQRYDIALYRRKNGKYVLHRVTEVHDGWYTIVGDNCTYTEKVTDDMICGVLAGFYRNGKRYVDCREGKAQRLYAKVWVALRPLRPAVLLAERIYHFVKRRLIKR